jgi:hypothetical protein
MESPDEVLEEANQIMSQANDVIADSHVVLGDAPSHVTQAVKAMDTKAKSVIRDDAAAAAELTKQVKHAVQPKRKPLTEPQTEVELDIATDRAHAPVTALAMDSILTDSQQTGLNRAFMQAAHARGYTVQAAIYAASMPTATVALPPSAASLDLTEFDATEHKAQRVAKDKKHEVISLFEPARKANKSRKDAPSLIMQAVKAAAKATKHKTSGHEVTALKAEAVPPPESLDFHPNLEHTIDADFPIAPHSRVNSTAPASGGGDDDTWWIVTVIVIIILVIGAVLLFIYMRNKKEEQQQMDWHRKKADMRARGGQWLSHGTNLKHKLEEMLMNRAPVAVVAPVRHELHSVISEGQGLAQQFLMDHLDQEANEIEGLLTHLRTLASSPDTGPAPPDAEERALVEAMQSNVHEFLRNAVATAETKLQAGQITEPPSLQPAKRQLQALPGRGAAAGCRTGCMPSKPRAAPRPGATQVVPPNPMQQTQPMPNVHQATNVPGPVPGHPPTPLR